MKKDQFKRNDSTVYMNVEMTSEYLHVAKSTIYKWVGDSYIPHKKLRKKVLFIKDDIDVWVRNEGVVVNDNPEVPKSILKSNRLPELTHLRETKKDRRTDNQHWLTKYRPVA